MNIKKFLSSVLAGSMVLGMISVPAFADSVPEPQENTAGTLVLFDAGDETDGNWADSADTSWYNDNDTEFSIASAEELAGLAELVNDGNTFSGKTITLTDNIDLGGKNWTPIGYLGKSFKGTFDGSNKTISNLSCVYELDNLAVNNGIGLFGKTEDSAVIKNFTIDNATVKGSLYVGAVAGLAYTGKEISNIKVTGDIYIDAWWYAGVIGGNGYMSTVQNCSVSANDDSYVKGNDGSYIGGIWGFRGEGGMKIEACSVENLEISGVDRVGGISGMLQYGNTIANCEVTNVTVAATDPKATTVGIIAGANQGTLNDPSILDNNHYSDMDVSIGGSPVDNPGLAGTDIYGNKPVLKTTKIGDIYYTTLAEAVEAAKEGDTVTLVSDIDMTDIAAGTFNVIDITGLTLDLNGKTITTNNGGVAYQGNNAKITNGKFEVANKGSYALFIGDEDESNQIVVENVTTKGGINVYNAKNVTLKDVTANAGGKYYVVWCDENAQVSIESGSYSSENSDPLLGIVSGKESSLTISGGTFTTLQGQKLVLEGSGNTVYEKPVIKGGIFTSDVSEYVADGFTLIPNSDNTYSVAPFDNIAKAITVKFVEHKDNKRIYDIVLTPADSEDTMFIHRLSAMELKFAIRQIEGAVGYEIEPDENINITTNPGDIYEFNFDGVNDKSDESGHEIKIGTVTFTGNGKIDFACVSYDGAKVNTAKASDNIVDTYIPNNAGTNYGELILNGANGEMNSDDENAIIKDAIFAPVTHTLTINIDFPNKVEAQAAAYQQMIVTISGGDLTAPHEFKLGNDDDGDDAILMSADGKYVIEDQLSELTAYTVTITGEGYRTARYTVNMQEENKVLNFWNNVKDNEEVIEVGKDLSKVKTNFLAGDIVKDNDINIYDLSAVVSYFGTTLNNLTDYQKYVKYDLNRDGVIDSKDVAYVLVSWGN